MNRESGRSFLDLLVDSLGLELGVAATQLATTPVAAFVFGVGIDVPLVTAPFRLALRLAFRWTYAAHETLPDETDIALLSALVVDVGVNTGLAAREGPRARREP